MKFARVVLVLLVAVSAAVGIWAGFFWQPPEGSYPWLRVAIAVMIFLTSALVLSSIIGVRKTQDGHFLLSRRSFCGKLMTWRNRCGAALNNDQMVKVDVCWLFTLTATLFIAAPMTIFFFFLFWLCLAESIFLVALLLIPVILAGGYSIYVVMTGICPKVYVLLWMPTSFFSCAFAVAYTSFGASRASSVLIGLAAAGAWFSIICVPLLKKVLPEKTVNMFGEGLKTINGQTCPTFLAGRDEQI